MTLSQTWLRQAFGAAGVSLLAPLAMLAAAGVLAAGGGLGGLSELGQITGGPTLPGGELDAAGGAIADADIIGAEAVATSGGTAAAPSSATGGVPGTLGAAPVGTNQLPSPLVDVPSAPVGGGNGGGEGLGEPPTQTPGSAPAAGGPAEVVETTRGIQNVVPEPIQPVTQNLINLLLGPPQP